MLFYYTIHVKKKKEDKPKNLDLCVVNHNQRHSHESLTLTNDQQHVENLQQYQAPQVDLGLPGNRRDPTDRTRRQVTELHCVLAAG